MVYRYMNRARSHLTAYHWNENVDTEYTSVWHLKYDSKAPGRCKGKKNLTIEKNIWRRYVRKIYKKCSQQMVLIAKTLFSKLLNIATHLNILGLDP